MDVDNKLRSCLYLDDQRTPTQTIPGYHPWIVDHDLAEEHMDDYFKQFAEKGFQQPDYESYKEKTGMDCANFVVEYCQRMKVSLKYCAVHSHNPVGAANIQSFINGFKKHMDETEDCFLMKPPFRIEEKK